MTYNVKTMTFVSATNTSATPILSAQIGTAGIESPKGRRFKSCCINLGKGNFLTSFNYNRILTFSE